MKRATGRPTKYSKEILRRARQYIGQCKDGWKKVLIGVNKRTHKKIYQYEESVNLPKAEGLAMYLEVSRDTLYEWAKQHKEFSDILELLNQTQADRVINKALNGEYNSLIAKLLLGKHGYKEESKQTIESEDLREFNRSIKKIAETKYDESGDEANKGSGKGDL